jgi:hypothetical protein
MSRTTSAPWAVRDFHTSVIDAAGAIYVLGGQYSGSTLYQDVWVSTDGGVRAGLGQGCWVVHQGGTRGYHGVLQGYSRVLRGTKGRIVVLRGTLGVVAGY